MLSFGTKSLVDIYIGQLRLVKLYIGNNVAYTPKLLSPNVTLSSGTISFSDVPNATSYSVLSDNSVIGNVSA